MGVDVSTLDGKLIMGYQGWFSCPTDSSSIPPGRWWHWFRENAPPDAPSLTVDMWPDTSEFGTDELVSTNMTFSDGRPAALYSAFTSSVVDRHFSWMRYNNLDGVMLQRFLCDLSDVVFKAFRDRVALNVMKSAETWGRGFAIMYDITGYRGTSIVQDITEDWTHLVDDLKLTNSSSYLKHKENPLLAIWGIGFNNEPGSTRDNYPATPQDTINLTSHFRARKVTMLGGVPYYWRTLTGDSKTDTAWANAYRSFDIISPWSIGRYAAQDINAIQQIDSIQANSMRADLAYLSGSNVEYLPVVFPGYSVRNKGNGPLNQIPRYGGRFWWRQVYNAILAGCTKIYGAMFDEVDEGTAMFKVVSDRQNLPREAQDRLVYLNADGFRLTSDWYLHLAEEAGKMLRHETTPSQLLPIQAG